MHGPLSSTGKRWILDDALAGGSEDTAAFIETLRARRGIADAEEGLAALYLPSLMTDAPKAADRILEAMRDGERVGIFGDYDCDGVTSTAQMVRFFRRRGVEPVVRLPHRVHDGYGLKAKHVDAFHASGAALLVTVDTGISSVEAVERAKELNIDVIILDHHHLPATLPDAYAILHPQLRAYPEPHPSAAGVVFEFLHTLEKGTWEDRDTDLALATFGTVADLVPLLGRNRLLVREGLAAMGRLPRGAVKELIDFITDKPSSLTSTDIAFRIAPRLNAAGRMADPMLALRALLEGGVFLGDLEKLNVERQQETKSSWAHALKKFYAPIGELPPFLCVANAAYQPGIVGLLAGKLTEAFGRPSMAVHVNGEEASASLRSPACYNIVEGLERCAALLTTYGGHAQAAGCTFPFKNLDLIREAISHDVLSRVTPEELVPALSVDGVLDPAAMSLQLCRDVAALGPFGQANNEPLFLLSNVTLTQQRTVGSEKQHLQAMLGGSKVIGFHLGAHEALSRSPLDIVARVGIDGWNGKFTPQLSVVDIRPAMGDAPSAKIQVPNKLLISNV